MTMYLPPHVEAVLRRLRGAGFPAYAVGGCVRDSLMDFNMPSDYDVATAATPEETLRVFAGERVVETGVKHGTVTVLIGGAPVEVTTFRVDGAYSDARRPDTVTFTPSLPDDLARRDFTVNAMAYGEDEGLIDPYGGAADVRRRVIRCVGDPDTRFREDALRILRALRFASVLGFRIEAETAAALRRRAPLLEKISAERVCSELCKLLCGKNARAVLLEYPDVLGVPIPEILPMVGFDQHNPYHIYDVWGHTTACVEAAPPTVALRLAALLHDIGKPPCFSLDAGGGHFYGHARISGEMADAILRRLRLDAATRERVVLLVRHHIGFEITEKAVKRALNQLGPEAYFQLLELMRADNLAQSPALRHRQAWIDELGRLARAALEAEACFTLKDLAVDGNDLIAAGCTPGPALGAALQTLLDAVIDGAVTNDKDKLLAFLKEKPE